MHRLFEDGAAVNKIFEVQVLGNVFCVFLAWHELVAEWHIYKIVVISLEGVDISLVADFNAHFAIAVGLFLNGHDAGHRIELINVFL